MIGVFLGAMLWNVSTETVAVVHDQDKRSNTFLDWQVDIGQHKSNGRGFMAVNALIFGAE